VLEFVSKQSKQSKQKINECGGGGKPGQERQGERPSSASELAAEWNKRKCTSEAEREQGLFARANRIPGDPFFPFWIRRVFVVLAWRCLKGLTKSPAPVIRDEAEESTNNWPPGACQATSARSIAPR